MSFLEKYLIVDKLDSAETMTFRAQNTLTGQPVLLHQLLPGRTPPHQQDLATLVFKYLPGAGKPGSEHFREMGQDDDRVFVVTADVPECLDVRNWLQSIIGSQGGGSTRTSSAELESVSTRWSGPDPSLSAAPEPVDDMAATVLTPMPAPSPAPLETPHEPGEFTKKFMGMGAAKPPAPPPPPPPAAAAKPADKAPRGKVPVGFEVVFQSKKQAPPADSSVTPTVMTTAPTPVEPTPPPAPIAPPDEFAQMFGGAAPVETDQALPAAPAAPSRPPSVAPPQPIADSSGPGEFTQMFSTAGKGQTVQPHAPTPAVTSRPPAPPPPPNESAAPGEFTQMFAGMGKGKASQPPASIPPPTPMPNMPPPQPVAEKSEPGEFTQMFKSPTASAGTPATPPPAPGETGPRAAAPAFPTEQPHATPAHQDSSSGPSEFTKMFKSGGAAPGTPAPASMGSPSQLTPSLPGAPKKGQGELTAMMQGYKSPTTPPAPGALEAPPPAPAAAPAKAEPGEYTKMFRPQVQPTTPPPPIGPPPPAPIQQATAPPPPQARQPGEYTSLFEAPRMPPPGQPAPPQAAPPPPGYGYPQVPMAPPPPPAMPQYQPPPQPQAPQMAYPQMPQAPQYQPPVAPTYTPPQYQAPQPPTYAPPQYQAPQVPAYGAGLAPAPQPQPVDASKQRRKMFLVVGIVLAVLFVVAVGLIVYFALKH